VCRGRRGRSTPGCSSARICAGCRSAGRRPPALGDDDRDVGCSGLLQRGVDRVHHGVEQVRVREPVAVVVHRRAGLERRVAEDDVVQVVPICEVRVHVGQQRRAGGREELRDAAHVWLGEPAHGRRVRVGDHIEADARGHLDDADEPRRVQGALDVVHCRDEAPGDVVLDLVADGDVHDVHVRVVRLDVGLHPRRRRRLGHGEAGDILVGDAKDEADARAAQGFHDVAVGAVDAHLGDAEGLVKLHGVLGRREVIADHSVAHANPTALRTTYTAQE
jgi:hypothetical protein